MTYSRKKKNIYCFDSSAFIALNRTSDSVIKIPESVWDHIEDMMNNGQLISHQIVFNELTSFSKNPDFVAKWIEDKKQFFYPKTDFQIVKVADIISKFPGLIDYKSEKEEADPWLIALALEQSKKDNLFEICVSVVVSQESSKKSQKIPAVCKNFEVRHLPLREFFDETGLKTQVVKKIKKTA